MVEILWLRQRVLDVISMIVGILVGLFVLWLGWNLLKGVLRLLGGLLVILFVIAAIGFAVTSIGRF